MAFADVIESSVYGLTNKFCGIKMCFCDKLPTNMDRTLFLASTAKCCEKCAPTSMAMYDSTNNIIGEYITVQDAHKSMQASQLCITANVFW